LQNFNNRILKAILLVILINVFSFIITSEIVKAEPVKYNILILNSYNNGFAFSDDETSAILSKLKSSKLSMDVSIEYIDWKRFPTTENLKNVYDSLKLKYKNQKTDLVIATDDAALEFSLKNRKELFSSAPVVFCGVNEEGIESLTKGALNVTGVRENIDPKNTVKLALKINPNIKNLYILYDNSESGTSTGIISRDVIKNTWKNLNVITLEDKSASNIIELSKHLDKRDSAFLITSYFKDIDGTPINFDYFIESLYKGSTVPIYDLYEFSLNHGAIGGSMLSGKVQGEKAAELGIRILNGEKASSIHNITSSNATYIVDNIILDHFSYRLSSIPKGTKVINKPFSFVKTYKPLVIAISTTFILMLIFIGVLISYITKIRKMKLLEEENNITLIFLNKELNLQFKELIEAKKELAESEELYRLIIEATNDGIWDQNITTKETFFSEKWFEMLGYDKTYFTKEIKDWKTLVHPEDLARVEARNKSSLEGKNDKYECEFRLKTVSGDYKWIKSRGKVIFEYGIPVRMTGSHIDISTIKEYENKLHYLAYHDTLTGLYNRLYIFEELSKYLENKRNASVDVILFIDVDNFKFINDTMGHTFGDKVIIRISERLSEFADENKVLSRFGGDEFIYFIKASTVEASENMARDILKSFEDAIVIEDNILNFTLSIGISVAPLNGTTIDLLLSSADMAMYRVKENGKNSYAFFDNLIKEEIETRVNIEKNLKGALARNEFSLFYQPQIDVKTKEIIGFEALLRWNSPKLGMVPPLSFINVAEETGYIINLGEWILETACNYVMNIINKKGKEFIISVNISVIQIVQDNFVDVIINVLKKSNLKPSLLELEITESIIMDSRDTIIDKLYKLREIGVRIAIDDFGTGYSSLAYLRKIPITTLKIDKLFIDDITNAENSLVTDSIIALGHQMGLNIVAEGVESYEQLDYLERHDCDIIQGYLFSKPLSIVDLEKFLMISDI